MYAIMMLLYFLLVELELGVASSTVSETVRLLLECESTPVSCM